jgi:hypothetical protein
MVLPGILMILVPRSPILLTTYSHENDAHTGIRSMYVGKLSWYTWTRVVPDV